METMNNVQGRSNSNYNFYTSNGWAGKNYDHNLSGKDIAAKVRAFVKNEFPGFKFSIRSKWGMQADTIYITVLSGPIPALCEGNTRSYESCVSGFGDAYKGRITDKMLAVLDKVYSFVSSFRYSDCDGMIDYFDTNFYCWMYVGDYNRPYQISEKKERNNNRANNPNQSEEEKPVETVSGFEIVEYSEKSIAVFGDTKLIKEELKALGGKFNPALKNNGEKRAGWIFPKKQADKVRALLAPASCACSETSPVFANQEKKKESEIMDQTSINQAVLERLYVIGQDIFENYVQIDKEGSYTASHLYNEKNAMGEPIRVSFSENPEYTVQVGPFRCKFPANFVFKLINRFEKLNNMGNKKMKVFTYGENPAEIVSAPCVYLDAEKEFKTGKKKIKKITDSLALLRMAGGRFRVMYHISGTWYQIYDCINGGSDFAEKRVNEFSALLSDDPERFQGMIFSYECTGGAYDQIIVAMRAAYGDSETSQTLEQEEQEEENRIRERFPLEGVTVEENTTGPNGVIYFTVEGAGPVTEARVRADLKPGDTFNVYTKDERKYGVTYDGVSLNRSIWNELPDIVEYEEKYYPEDCPTDTDGNRFYTDVREDYAPFPYVVVDRLDGSVWFFTDSEDEAKEWAADYNQEYSDGGKRKKQPDVEHEVIRTDLAKCAG